MTGTATPLPPAPVVSENRTMRIRHIGIALRGVGLLTLLLLASDGTAAAQITRWQVGADTREAIVFVPDALARDRPHPLIFAFHGFGDHMQNFQHTNLHLAWPEAIVVYVRGLERRAGMRGWQIERDGLDRDLKLVDTALAALRGTYDIDDDRIYATGFSNGGMFTYLLWAERPDIFAAYAPIAARLPASVRPARPRPLFHVAGTRDQVVRFSDQEAAIALAASINGGTRRTECGAGCTVYGADTPAPVRAWIHDGAHVYPRGTSEQIVAFFQTHRRSP